jgi:hypothetical protein
VLSAQGVEVVVARGIENLLEIDVDDRTTVFVASTQLLTPGPVDELITYSAPAERLVVATDDPWAPPVFGLSGSTRPFPAGAAEVAGDCGVADVRPGERLSWVDQGLDAPAGPGVHPCYTDFDIAAYVLLDRGTRGGPTVLLSDPSLLTNRRIAEGDQGAMALRALGHSPRLVWYVPTLADSAGSADRVIARALPPWFRPGLAVIAATFAAVVLWRGRRLGRLVPEPLPVVVRAVETTVSRGAMYRKSHDAGRAGRILQDATVTRLARRLGIPSAAPPSVVADRAAEVCGLDPVAVSALLTTSATDDAGLTRLAAGLADLERSVTARPDPTTTRT